MTTILRRVIRMLSFMSVAAIAISASGATILSEDFDDGGGVNSVFNFTNSEGQQAVVMSGGPTGNFARLTHLSPFSVNSLAFDLVPRTPSGGLTISFDFRMTDDAANQAAGSALLEAADGLGIGLFDSNLFPTTGPLNPMLFWEDPRSDAPAGSVVMGFDIFDLGGSGGNDVRMTGLGGAAELLAAPAAPFTLNSNVFHHATWSFRDIGNDAMMSLVLVEDVNGAAVVHNLLAGILVPGFDLDTFTGRLILGARTGSAYTDGDVDNVLITPEPQTFLLLTMGLLGMVLWSRTAVVGRAQTQAISASYGRRRELTPAPR